MTKTVTVPARPDIVTILTRCRGSHSQYCNARAPDEGVHWAAIPHCPLTILSSLPFFRSQVHMGTHMWTGGGPQVSRRGRRMSLELPPGVPPPGIPITTTPHKDTEFLQQRQQQRSQCSPPPPPPQLPLPPPPPQPRELSFFPYLPTPFSVAAAAAVATTTTTNNAATNSDTAIPRTSVSKGPSADIF